MPKFTEGPWLVQHSEYPIRRIVSASGISHFWICDVFQVDTEEATRANVLLIKASPFMFDALKIAEKALTETDRPRSELHNHALNCIWEAIKEAGERK